jgi:putative transposase
MATITRRLLFRFYPTKKQGHRMDAQRYLHHRLYNAALEHRCRNYDLIGKSISFSAQCLALTQLRARRPEYNALNAQSSQVTLKRVDLAFQHFFRHVRKGIRPAGFPRFKSLDRYKGWGYKTHGDGWALMTNQDMHHGKIRLSGIGDVKIRGGARIPGIPKTLDVMKKGERWYASVVIECVPQRNHGTKAAGFDWGTETFLTIAEQDGTVNTIENPRLTRHAAKEIKRAQKDLSRKQKGSRNRRKARQHLAKLHHRMANKRKEFLHQTTNELMNTYGLLATESLNIKHLTAKGGSRKRALNREILSTAPGTFLNILACKAEEAGSWYQIFSSRKIKASQTCHGCGRQEKKLLSQRWHSCPCGVSCGRDVNAAKVCLHWALFGKAPGSERTRCAERSAGLPQSRKAKLCSKKQESPTTTVSV